jgi:ribonuclease HI
VCFVHYCTICFGLVCFYFCVNEFCFILSFLYPALCLNAQMSTSFPIHFGFVDGASRHTQNLASAAWTIYHSGELVSSGGTCLGPATNNVAEYHTIIGLLTEATSLDISQIIINLDSQLVVCQLNHIYTIQNPILLRLYLRVRHLERFFTYVEYQHIPRELNTITNSLANYMLDWHLTHR